MEADDDVPLILTWDDVNSGLLNEETERADESKWNYIYHLCIGKLIYACIAATKNLAFCFGIS